MVTAMKKKNKITNTLFMIAFGVIIASLLDFGLTESVIFFFIGIMLISLYRVWKFREHVKQVMKSVEAIIFNKPLDKELWDKGEMKNTKVEVVWSDKKKKGKSKGLFKR
jgi:hypothetical protein